MRPSGLTRRDIRWLRHLAKGRKPTRKMTWYREIAHLVHRGFMRALARNDSFVCRVYITQKGLRAIREAERGV